MHRFAHWLILLALAALLPGCSDVFLEPEPGETQVDVQVEGVRVSQSVQNAEGAVPLVAGRDAVLRVFLKSDHENFLYPNARVWLFLEGTLADTIHVPADGSIPTTTNRDDIQASRNARIPGRLVQPGLSVRVEVDSSGIDQLGRDSQLEYPRGDTSLSLDVREVPPFKVRLVPIRPGYADETGEVSEENAEAYLQHLLDLFPLSEYDVDVRAPFSTDATTTRGIVEDLRAARESDGSNRYYYGVIPQSDDLGFGGRGFLGGRTAVGVELEDGERAQQVLAHEIGHNFGRRHAPCGDPESVDSDYPYADARIGVYGVEVNEGGIEEIKPPSEFKDLMSYCSPQWISDYTYMGVLEYRAANDGDLATAPPSGEPVLLVRGSVNGSEIDLAPAFSVTAPPHLPAESGPYTLVGRDAQGHRLFSFSFAGTRIADEPPGARSFVLAIPQSRAQLDRLAELKVRGRGASATVRGTLPDKRGEAVAGLAASVRRVDNRTAALQWNASRYEAALVKDAQTGRGLALVRGGQGTLRTQAREVEVLFSDGVHTVRRRVTVR